MISPVRTLILSVVIFVVLEYRFKGVTASEAEEKLRSDLFTGYNKSVRPAKTPGETVVVDVVLAITQIIDVDEKRQVVIASLWIYQIWKDYRLQWDPVKYDGIFNIAVPAKEIWFPDTALYQSANEEHPNFPQVIAINTIGIVHSNGSVTMCSAHLYEIPCPMQIKDFPFDYQSCPILFGTWVHFKEDLDFRVSPKYAGIEQESFISNSEWEITGSTAERYDAEFLTFPGKYAYLQFILDIRRKPLFYIINLNIPCALFSILTVLVFYLPPDSADKIPLSVSILLTLFVFNLLVADIMPATSDATPVLSVYLMVSMASVVFAVILSAFVMKLHNSTGEVPIRIKKIFIYILPKYIFLSQRDRFKKKAVRLERNNSQGFMPSPIPGLRRTFVTTRRSEFSESEIPMMNVNHDDVYTKRTMGMESFKTGDLVSTQVLRRLDTIIEELKRQSERVPVDQGEEDWKLVGAAINRILLIFYFLLFMASTIWVFTS
ncbi:neuronal acetylcholine receptor subunit alpha-6-like [Glandiceps talaboti]